MNQLRTLLFFAWIAVAFLLWQAWSSEHAVPPPAAVASAQPGDVAAANPVIPTASVPQASAAAAPAAAARAAPHGPVVRLRSDVLALELDGSTIVRADLLRFPQTRDPGSAPVVLLDPTPASLFEASAAWMGADGSALAFQPVGAARSYELAPQQAAVTAQFEANTATGLRIVRSIRLERGSYALQVRDEVVNAGSAQWTGDIRRTLVRVPAVTKRSFFNPETISLNGAAWYSPEDKYKKRRYPDFAKDGPLNQAVTGGWIGLSQHYFLAAWVPQPDQGALFSLAERGAQYQVDATGPRITLAPGQQFTSTSTLWIGPKDAQLLDAVAPGLGLSLDYGIFTVFAKPIHWLLTQLHKITGNWGWAIVLLVLLIKVLLYPLSAKQYQSMAKMRKFQPRIAQLKERYGDDKQKFQLAMMDLYKREKVNPAGGCLPLLIQMPIFLALYYVLIEAIELRHAPWIMGWISDLTAPDPYFILPILNGVVMFLTQKMTPTAGMDPMQAKMMQAMPVVMAVMFALFPAGLVLYWVTNGALGMLQQWMNLKRFEEPKERAPTVN